ncbi:MAG: acetyl-CoA carboxylase biotin carboxylase subunit [Phycisphaerae bacterium]|nr:acetyl-CoA carboxylase biotin carboxylase subunit [Phycisphaerae bacterium]
MFSRVLIANRGEIAVRILRACRELGIETVCVFSDEDRHAPYLAWANRAICIGAGPPGESYLRSDRVIAAAEVANVDAIHPGYGFLAENARFAEQCREAKIEFIGPSAETMSLVGDKAVARKMAKTAKVPTVPGSGGRLEDDEEAVALAEKIGYPVMIKAAAGGGGRGIRIAHNEANLRASLHQARLEAGNAFKDDGLYVEKVIETARHVEVQILGDKAGQVLHFYDRDCTLQRRYQKLIEEAPSSAIDSRTRDELCKAAVKIARAAKYFNAGTVEFLVDPKQNFYFTEVNARIQVEHPVTEMITGHDLVKWQLRLAAGESLSLKQRDIQATGTAIECRVNAENPADRFRPCPGPIDRFEPPGGFGVRVDTYVVPGIRVSPRYDSMIAKLVVHKRTRSEAIACMQRCLAEFIIEPIATTIPFHREILAHERFLNNKVDTGFIERTW